MLTWEVRYKVAIGVARAVEHLHYGTDKCVIHRDIKPSNILLSSNRTPKVKFLSMLLPPFIDLCIQVMYGFIC